MQKKNFVSVLLGTVGGLTFGMGMCMCLLPDFGAFVPGVILGVVGLVVLLLMLVVRRRMAGKPPIHITGKAAATGLLGAVGTLALGVGLCCVMLWPAYTIAGIVAGCAGILLLVCLVPFYKGIKE